ncbi:MAG: S8 family peptidase [Lachnospiraceae bacterium]|nr:S8 family peptidase [Lachnospiraceae bacterium]
MDCKERILSNEYADGVIDFPIERIVREGDDVCYIPLDERYSVAYINRQLAPGFEESSFQYGYTPKLYGLMQMEEGIGYGGAVFDPSSLIASGIRQLQGPPLNLRGNGVIVGIIDTGIDYANEAFLDVNGESRILAIWDQTIQDGIPPEGFFFGSQYLREDINTALQTENPLQVVPVQDPLRHGTIMAGIAAGSLVNGGSTYIGAAPEAEIVVVKLKEAKEYLREYYFVPDRVPAYEETDIMLGIAYVNKFAIEFRRPVVICLGLGTNIGDHAGNSMLGRYLSKVALQRSRAVIICGGNEGIANHHFTWDFRQEINGESIKNAEVRVGEGEKGFLLEFWGNAPDTYNISVRSPGGETIPPIRLGVEEINTYEFIFENTIVSIQSTLVEAGSGEQFIRFRFREPTPGIWNFQVQRLGEVYNGRFHMWLPVTAFMSSNTFFLEASPDTTLTEPSNAEEVITVSNYNHVNNSFYLESGRGYSRTNMIRPDLAAPGVNVPTLYGNRTGSSLAAAITAGGVAQFLQWAVVERNSPLADTREVRNFLIKGARRQAGLNYPNQEWGFGALNVYGIFEELTGNNR